MNEKRSETESVEFAEMSPHPVDGPGIATFIFPAGSDERGTEEEQTSMHDHRNDRVRSRRELEYTIHLHGLHERLYRRIARIVRFIELFGGSAALFSAIGEHRPIMAAAGLLVAASAYASISFKFDHSEQVHAEVRRALEGLLARSHSLTPEELATHRVTLDNAPPAIEGLRVPAYNEVMRRYGLDGQTKRLTGWQRFVQALA